MTNPANDPVLTVRRHPHQDPQHPLTSRVIKTADGAWRWLEDGMLLPEDDEVLDWPWPVQPLPEVARVLEHPEPATAAAKDNSQYWQRMYDEVMANPESRKKIEDFFAVDEAAVPEPVEDADATDTMWPQRRVTE